MRKEELIERVEIDDPFDVFEQESISPVETPSTEIVDDPVDTDDHIERESVSEDPITPAEESPTEDPTEDPVDDVANVQIKTNIPALLASRLKQDGLIAEDFEVGDETTAEDVENAYRSYNAEKIEKEKEYEVRQKLLEEYGGENVLEAAKKIRLGATEKDLEEEDVYGLLANADFDDIEVDKYDKAVEALFTNYYLAKGLSETEAMTNTQRDIEDGGIDDLVETRQGFFKEEVQNIQERYKRLEKEEKEKEKAKEEERISFVEERLESGEIDGFKYSTEDMQKVKAALFNKTETIVIDNKRIRVTKYQKKKHERAQDKEKQLADIANFILGVNRQTITKKSKKTAKKEILDNLNDLIEVSVDLSRNERNPDKQSDIVRRALG